jgi:Sulfatase
MRRSAVVVAVILIVAIAPRGAGEAVDIQPASSAPNVLLIQADDLGYGDLSAYGATRLRTPHIDSLAALLGESKAGRDQLVEQAGALPLITGRWKLISPNAALE